MSIENNFCLQCEHELVCSIKEKHLNKFTLEEDDKKYLGVNITLDACKNFALAKDELEITE